MAKPVRVSDDHYRYEVVPGVTYDVRRAYGGWVAYDSDAKVIVPARPRLTQVVAELDKTHH
jgi:hypothetical protein